MFAEIDGSTLTLIGLFITLFLAILGCYIFVFKSSSTIMAKISAELGKIYTVINTHVQSTDVHLKADAVVEKTVCEEIQKRMDTSITQICAKIDRQSEVLKGLEINTAMLNERVTNLIDSLGK
jgi:translation initiation factor 2 alpha subunit (eIF-2alpha)